MEIFGFILLGIVGIAVAVYLFYLCRAIIAIAAILLAVYLCFFKDSLLAAGIVLGGWLVLNNAMDKIVRKFAGTEEESTPKKKKKNKSFSSRSSVTKTGSSSINWNYILMWMIPLFWPYLIFRTFFRDKQVGELNAYDYEQHLRSNGK
ncbi:hypothetical protein [Bacteroides cellulosilyticus]|uniref:hypothetical protein n=1 Tax=Bacteroides cellulosilyticus TaxID=246787 RepID=UPI003566897E